MRADSERDELRDLIRDSFDKSNPEAYMKNRILSDIEEQNEDNDGKRTVMQSLFMVRKVCVACIALILIVAFSGGTYSAVSLIKNGGNPDNNNSAVNNIDKSEGEDENKNKADNENTEEGEEDGQEADETDKYEQYIPSYDTTTVLRSVFEGKLKPDNPKYYDREMDDITDLRLAEALKSACWSVVEQETVGDDAYMDLGTVFGSGLSDRVFDKNEYRVYSAYVISDPEFSVLDYEYYAAQIGWLDTVVKNNSIEGRLEKKQPVYQFQYEGMLYVILDMTDEYMGFSKRFPVVWGNYLSGDGCVMWYEPFLCDKNSIDFTKNMNSYYELYDKNRVKQDCFNVLAKYYDTVTGEFDFDDYDWVEAGYSLDKVMEFTKNYIKAQERNQAYIASGVNDETNAFDRKYSKTYMDKGVTLTLDEDAFKMPVQLGERGENMTESRLSHERRVIFPFSGIEIEGDIETIEFRVPGATIYKVIEADVDKEKQYEKLGYLGSEVVDTGKYDVYQDYGSTLTLSADEVDSLDKYGIYLWNKSVDYSKYDNYDDAIYDNNFWYADYLKNNVMIVITVKTSSGNVTNSIVFGSVKYYLETFRYATMLYGWEK